MLEYFNKHVAVWLAEHDASEADLPALLQGCHPPCEPKFGRQTRLTLSQQLVRDFGPTCERGYRIVNTAAEMVEFWAEAGDCKTPKDVYEALSKFVQSYSCIPIRAVSMTQSLILTYGAGSTQGIMWPLTIRHFEQAIQDIEDA